MTEAETLQRIEALTLAGQADRAFDLARDALDREPDDPRLNAIAGALGAQLGRWEMAETFLRKALAGTDNAAVHLNLAIVLRNTGRAGEAIKRLESLIGRGDADDPVRLTLANAYDAEGRTEDALRTVETIAAPGWEANYNRGTFLYRLHRFEEALAAFDACAGRRDFSLHYNRALTLIERGRFADAAQELEAGLTSNPGEANARWHLAQCRLHLAEYAAAWPHYQARYAATDLPRHPRAQSPEEARLSGKRVFVYAEQGVGDEMLFSRMIQPLADRARAVAWECEPRLVGLFATAYPGIDFVARGTGRDLEDRAEVRITAPDLGLLLDFNPRTAPEPPSLSLGADTAPKEPDGPARIGISLFTAGSHAWKRMPPADRWRGLLARRDVSFVGLDTPSAAFTAWAGDLAPPPLDGFDAGSDFAETAERLTALDGIVTIDNTLANLAGFLGLPAVVMLSRSPDWRWGPAENQTPWYPALTLARQDGDGSWDRAFAAAERFVEEKARRGP